jgi:hypothetical protein
LLHFIHLAVLAISQPVQKVLIAMPFHLSSFFILYYEQMLEHFTFFGEFGMMPDDIDIEFFRQFNGSFECGIIPNRLFD